MKKFNVLSVLLLAILTTTFISCNNDDDSTPQGPGEGQFVATIDGEAFSSSSTNVGASLFNGIFNITALNTTTNEVVTVTVSGAQEGTFDLGPDGNGQSGGSYNINGQNAYLSVVEGGSGTITITKLDTENNLASGTFSFVGVRESSVGVFEMVTIEGGAFEDIALATEVQGNPNNAFNADIDGVAFNPDAITATEVTFQGQTTISISAINNSTNQNIGISFPGDTTAGTYDFSALPTSGAIVGQYNPDLGNGSSYVSVDGTITIDSIDTVAGTAEGTFVFTAGDFLGQDPTTYAITNGTFSVEY